MSLRFQRRIGLGRGTFANVGKTGVSVSKRFRFGSLSSRGTGSVRLGRGLSWIFGKRR